MTLTNTPFALDRANDYQKEHNRIAYSTIIDFYCKDILLCNNIADADPSIWENIECGSVYDEETDEYTDIFQYYLCRLNEYEIESINEFNKAYDENIIIAYSDLLDVDVLMVDHLGTSWDYVLTRCPLKEGDDK